MRVVIVRGPHEGVRIDHEGGPFIRLQEKTRYSTRLAPLRLSTRLLPADVVEPFGPPAPVLYRIFSKARADDARGDLYAAEWCEEHDAFRDRCPHAPASRTRVWARFGPRRDQTGLEAGAPGARESKWHLLSNDRQVSEPWLTICDLIVYGPIIEEYRSPVLTPIGAATCRNCKSRAGVGERLIFGSGGELVR